MSYLVRIRVFWIGLALCVAFAGSVQAQGHIKQVECSGTVVDWRGQPVDGAEIIGAELLYDYAAGRTRWGPTTRTTAEQDGRFRLLISAERQDYISVVAWKDGLAVGWQSPRFTQSTDDMTVRLTEPAVLAGTVVDETGQGVDSAALRVCLKMRWMGGAPGVTFDTPADCLTTHTDGQGRFRFDCIPVGATADLWVEAPGKASCWTNWQHARSSVPGNRYQAGQTDVRIVLKPEGIIKGKVVDEDSGRGVPGVCLLARRNEGYANYSSVPPVVSGPDGAFVYSGLEADDYSLQVVAPYEQEANWVGKDVKVTVASGQTAEVSVPVSKGGILEVTVLDAGTEKPVENARVNISVPAHFGLHPCWYHALRTDADGLARLRAPLGECQLNISGDRFDYLTHPDPPVIAKGEVVKREAVLTPFPTVTGTVSGPDGHPASGVIVASKPVCQGEVQTDAEGRYEVCWRPYDSIRGVQILARDPRRNLAGLAEVKNEDQRVDVMLAPAYVVRGRVTDPNGKPIPLATISLWASMPGWRTSGAPDVVTDANGLYEFRAVVAPREGFQYRLGLSAEGFGPTEHRDLPFGTAQNRQVDIATITLMPANRSISGAIVDANGAPVPGVPIFISGPRGSDTAGQPRAQTSSDEEGRFAVQGVCAGPLRIQAGFGEDAGFLDAEGGDHDVEVVLGRSGVHSKLKALLGKPLPDLSDLIDLDTDQTQDKALLLCFFDFQQRPSRNTLLQLARQASDLSERSVVVIAIQASEAEDDALSAWIEQAKVTLPVGALTGDVEDARLGWGVKSLPWLVLADVNRIVRAEGFALTDIETQLALVGGNQ